MLARLQWHKIIHSDNLLNEWMHHHQWFFALMRNCFRPFATTNLIVNGISLKFQKYSRGESTLKSPQTEVVSCQVLDNASYMWVRPSNWIEKRIFLNELNQINVKLSSQGEKKCRHLPANSMNEKRNNGVSRDWY